jgi:hypothetical protein
MRSPCATVRASDRLTVDIIFDRDGMRGLWNPRPPFPFNITAKEIDAYRRGRNDLLQEYSRAIGGNVMVIEPDGNGGRMDVIAPEYIDTKIMD